MGAGASSTSSSPVYLVGRDEGVASRALGGRGGGGAGAGGAGGGQRVAVGSVSAREPARWWWGWNANRRESREARRVHKAGEASARAAAETARHDEPLSVNAEV